MFRSPQKLRSGSKGAPVPLFRDSSVQSKSADNKKLQRYLSVPSSAGVSSATLSPTKTITMPNSDKSVARATVEQCVNTYLTSEDVVNQLVTRLSQEMKGVVEAAVQSALATVNQEVQKLREEVTALTERLEELDRRSETRMDDLEQYDRRNNLRVFGIEESAGEDTDSKVLRICKEKLGVELLTSAISRSHRVGKVTQDADGRRRHRGIIVRFVSYRDRQKVYSAKKKLKGSGVTIREDLSVRRMEVYRRAVDLHGPRNTWTQDGRVLWLDRDGNKGMATHLVDLQD